MAETALPLGTVPNDFYTSLASVLSWTDTSTSLQYGHTYYFRVYVFNETKATAGGGMIPACYANTIVGVSDVLTVVIPPAPTPTPSVTPTK